MTSAVSSTAEVAADVTLEPFCVVEPGARIGRGTRVLAGSYIGPDVTVGEDCRIGPNAVLMAGVQMGHRVVVGSGVVLGADGFGYVMEGGVHHKIPQVGIVEIGDDVVLAANACVDRATTTATRVGPGSFIGSLVQIAHNVQVGAATRVDPQTGLAGSCQVGDRVVVGGQVGVQQHVKVGNDVRIGPKAGVIKDIPDGEHVEGFPARPAPEFEALEAAMQQLPELVRRVGRRASSPAEE